MKKEYAYAEINDHGHCLLAKFKRFKNSYESLNENFLGEFSALVKEYERLLQMIEVIMLDAKEKNVQLINIKKMDEIKSDFYDSISQELRIPLALMIGSLEDKGSYQLCMEQRQKLAFIMRNVYRSFYLVNQLVELSGLCRGKNTLCVYRRNIVSFLKGIFCSLEILFCEHELQFVFKSQEENIDLYFDTEKLEKVFLYILINAIKFTPIGGKVSVAIKKTGLLSEQVEIAIVDTGLGISQDNLIYVFDRFFQYRSVNENKPAGSIIGLSIAKYLIEIHHGTFAIKSNLGKGTIVTIQLPVEDSLFKHEQVLEDNETSFVSQVHFDTQFLDSIQRIEINSQKFDNKTSLENRKNVILLVENQNDIRVYIKESLQQFYQIIEAKDVEQGLYKAIEAKPDLIISDVTPGIDGYEFCSKLKENIHTCHIPIIFLTAQTSEESIIRGLKNGVDDYIITPFNSNILRHKIQNLINLRSVLKKAFKEQMNLHTAKIPAAEFMRELEQELEKRISNPNFNVEDLSRKLCMDRTTIYRKLQLITGQSPTDFIRSYRLMRAAELLKSNFGTVLDVALKVGFSSASYFTKCFKREFQMLPSDFRVR